MDIPEISDATELDQFLQDNDKVVISYYAPECVNCKLISYYLHNFAKEYNNVKFIKCNMNKIHGLREKLHINTLPVVFFYRDAKIVCRYIGTMEKTIRGAINQYMK